jgi:hypothetical protein
MATWLFIAFYQSFRHPDERRIIFYQHPIDGCAVCLHLAIEILFRAVHDIPLFAFDILPRNRPVVNAALDPLVAKIVLKAVPQRIPSIAVVDDPMGKKLERIPASPENLIRSRSSVRGSLAVPSAAVWAGDWARRARHSFIRSKGSWFAKSLSGKWLGKLSCGFDPRRLHHFPALVP